MADATLTITAPTLRTPWDRTLVWLGAAVVLTVFDAVATAVWVELGLAVEGNPLLAALIDQIGLGPAMVVRAVVGIGLLVALAATTPVSRVARRALPLITAVLAAVALWHTLGALAAL